MFRLSLLASVSLLALAAGTARSQTVAAPQGAASSAQKAVDTGQLQTITITAQRVAESAQKAAIAITVVRPDELINKNVTRAEDLSLVVPALVATASGGPNTSFFLRGVGNITSNSYSDPAISFNYDGVYIGRPNSTQGYFYDLERVEVLEGPQGTLYGRNATGGAINVLPRHPELKTDSAEIQASYGNYAATHVQVALNHAIGDDTAVRLSATSDKHKGYLSDGTSDQDQRGVRGQILTRLTPNLTTRFDADYSHQGGAGVGSFIYGTYALAGPTGPYTFTPTPQLGPKIGSSDPRTEAFVQTLFIPQAGRLSEAVNSYPFQDDSNWGLTNETNWTTDAGTLTVQAAYRRSGIDALNTTSNFRGFYENEKSDQKTLEARFAGKLGSTIDYLIGGFYFDENISDTSLINQLTVLPIQIYDTGTNSKAIFGRLAFHATDALTLTAAGRFTDDLKKMNGQSTVYALFCGSPAPPQDFCPTAPLMPLVRTAADVVAFYTAKGIAFGPPGSAGPNAATISTTQLATDATLTTRKFTYRLAADLQLTPANMVYASYETGFHGGGFNFGKGLETYAPETIGAFTVGSKNRFLDNRLQLNVEGFYWKYDNQQISQFGSDFSTPPASVFYTSNIGKSTIKGIDVDLEARATATTRINGGIQYLDTVYNSYTVYAPTQGPPPNFNCPFSIATYRGGPAYAINCSGKPSLFSPKWSFNLGLEQIVDIGDYDLVAHGGTHYRGDFYAASSYQPWVISKAGFQSDASLTLQPHSDRWFVTAFVDNIENTRRITQVGVNGSLSTQSAISTAPRIYGVRLGARF